MVTIRFFAGAAEAAGTSSLQVEIPKQVKVLYNG